MASLKQDLMLGTTHGGLPTPRAKLLDSLLPGTALSPATDPVGFLRVAFGDSHRLDAKMAADLGGRAQAIIDSLTWKERMRGG